MANTIRAGDKTFEFDNLHLGNPHSLQGGSYFSKILFGATDECVYIQTPKCSTNKGIIKTGKKEYVDLLLTNDNINFIEWMNNLEERIQELIYEKRDTWFAQADELEMDDIQERFTPPIKVYKGTNYLVRCYLHSTRGIVSTVNIFDENQVPKVSEDVTIDCSIISIIEVQGLRFSQKIFQIDITVKQLMILNNEPMFNNCMINPSITPTELALTSNDKQSMDQQSMDQQSMDQQSTDQQNTEKQSTEKQSTEKQSTEKQSTEKQSTEKQSTEEQSTMKQSTEEQSTMKQSTEEQSTEEQKTEEQSTDNKINLDIHLDPINDFGLEEVTFENSGLNNLDSFTLKKPTEIYYEMYKDAKSKAKSARKKALEMFLKAKQIKDKYALEEMDDSGEEDEMEFLFNNS